MEEKWWNYWKRSVIVSVIGLPLVWFLRSPVSTWLFIGGAAYALSSLQQPDTEEVDWGSLLKGFSVYLVLIIAIAAISFHQ